ncbi:HPP family protein [Pseudomonas sp. LRF_L74]|uniref:HPP family protein n=1 Tax=Pseudomonas sp. LRF_L74 TaxID=3369422 RepID=UPI003F601BA6
MSSPSNSSSLRLRLYQSLKAFWPKPQAIAHREKLRASCGALLGILLVALGAGWWLNGLPAHEHGLLALTLVAPLGASAVLVFAVPASPLAQPWSVVGGNTFSALIGIACFKWVPDASLAAGLAVGLAIAVMFGLRCLHPPGGASALLMVLIGCDHFSFAFSPVLLDSLLLVAGGLFYNNLTRRSWPHVAPAPAKPQEKPAHFTRGDLDAALAQYQEVLDISRDDLQSLFEKAEAVAYQRTMGEMRCADVMSREPVAARQEMLLTEAWALMRKHRIKALPVIDRQRHLLGILTVADFMRQIDLDVHQGIAWRLRAMLRRGDSHGAGHAHTVAQIMTRSVRVASSDRLLIDLVPVFSDGGHRHIPIIDGERRLVGIITQSDLIKALYAAVRI